MVYAGWCNISFYQRGTRALSRLFWKQVNRSNKTCVLVCSVPRFKFLQFLLLGTHEEVSVCIASMYNRTTAPHFLRTFVDGTIAVRVWTLYKCRLCTIVTIILWTLTARTIACVVLLWTFAEAKKFIGRFSICSYGFPRVNRFKYRTSLNGHIAALVRQIWFRLFADLNVSSTKSTYQHVSHSRKECEWADDRPRMQQKMDQEELIENKYVVWISKNIAATFIKKTCEGEEIEKEMNQPGKMNFNLIFV